MTPRQGTCQESSSVRPKRTAVIRRTPSPFAIIRFARGKSTFGFRYVPELKSALVRDGVRLHNRFHGLLRGNDAAVNLKGEKTIPARSAAVRGNAKQSKNPGEQSHPVLARNTLQIHVAAQSAVHVPDISDGSRPGEKTRVANSAAPRPQPYHSRQIVLGAAPARPPRTVTHAHWT
jgi:hypothetical protein